MKDICYKIIEEEKRKYQLDINAFPVTIVENYKTETIKKISN